MEFAMPPRGVTTHRNVTGGVSWSRTIWRCEVEGCWHVQILRDEKKGTLDDARARHKSGTYGFYCPSPPMRESLPSGLPEIEKLWREMDDITDALIGKTEYRGMIDATLKAYAQGIAFCIVMKDTSIFPDAKSVSVEAAARWKMRNDKLPYRKTPTNQNVNGSWMAAGGWNAEEHGSVAPLQKKSSATPAITAALTKVDPDKALAIKNALRSKMFTEQDLAEVYKLPIALIKQIGAES